MLKVNAKNFSEAIELMEGLPQKLTKKDSPSNKKVLLNNETSNILIIT
jgi:glycosylphosphatidylinositol transamidase (GPIT) subunit GPI8